MLSRVALSETACVRHTLAGATFIRPARQIIGAPKGQEKLPAGVSCAWEAMPPTLLMLSLTPVYPCCSRLGATARKLTLRVPLLIRVLAQAWQYVSSVRPDELLLVGAR